MFEHTQHTVSQHFLSALINGDFTGLDDPEVSQLVQWFEDATRPWRDADDNLWVFSHEATDEKDDQEFARCEVTDLMSATSQLTLHFVRG